jgi:hypothetical protein
VVRVITVASSCRVPPFALTRFASARAAREPSGRLRAGSSVEKCPPALIGTEHSRHHTPFDGTPYTRSTESNHCSLLDSHEIDPTMPAVDYPTRRVRAAQWIDHASGRTGAEHDSPFDFGPRSVDRHGKALREVGRNTVRVLGRRAPARKVRLDAHLPAEAFQP